MGNKKENITEIRMYRGVHDPVYRSTYLVENLDWDFSEDTHMSVSSSCGMPMISFSRGAFQEVIKGGIRKSFHFFDIIYVEVHPDTAQKILDTWERNWPTT